MSVPSISPTSSILDFPIGELWVFQPSASGSPTSWSWSGLPPGIYANAATGAIGGLCTTMGIWVATVSASNADGTSQVMEMPISIYSGAWASAPSIEVRLDATTGAVISPSSFSIKTDTDLILDVCFLDSAGNLLSLPLANLSFVVKAADCGDVLIATDGTFTQIGDVTTRHFRMILAARGDELSDQLAIEATTGSPVFSGHGEFRWRHYLVQGAQQIFLNKISSSVPVTVTRNLLAS